MTWGTCYSGSNNIHFDFPSIMSDGRNYSNWQPGAVINEELSKEKILHQIGNIENFFKIMQMKL